MNKKTLSNYILAFDEINALTAVSYNTASETTEDQTVQVSQIADDISSQEIYRGYRLLLNLNFTEYTTLRFWMEDTSTNPVLDMG